MNYVTAKIQKNNINTILTEKKNGTTEFGMKLIKLTNLGLLHIWALSKSNGRSPRLSVFVVLY